jgi:hypothetical protein
MYRKTNMPGWSKDTRTRFVVNTNDAERLQFKAQFEQFKKRKALETRLESLEALVAQLLESKKE